MRVEWGTHSLESLNHLSLFTKLGRAAQKSQGNLLDLVYWKKNYNKETYAYRCFFLKVFYIIHQSNQNMKTNFDNILRLQNTIWISEQFALWRCKLLSENVNKKTPVLQNIMQKVVKKHKFLALIVANARLFLRKWSILDRYQVHHLCLVYKLQQQLRGKLKTERGQTLSQLQSQTIGWEVG